MELYEREKIESMNYILGKPEDNKAFTKFELEAMNKVDLFNRNVVNICRIIWDNRDNPEKLESYMAQLENEIKERKESGNNGNTSINNSVNQVVENPQV